MKIIKLTTENIKRLVAVEVTPDGSVIKIAGKNGAGKSSVLDSIAYALGGKDLVPSAPIRNGETEAKIVVDLGDLVVTRKFSRDRGVCNCKSPAEAELLGFRYEHDKDCEALKFGETRSTLKVSNKEGASYPSPQAVLDKLLGKLSFDPLQFARDDRKRQDETLRSLVKLDVKPFEEARTAAASRRAVLKKQLTEAEVTLKNLPAFPSAKEIPLADISQEMLKAEELRKVASDIGRKLEKHTDEVVALERQKTLWTERVEEARKALANAEAKLTQFTEDLTAAGKEGQALRSQYDAAYAAIPDMTAVRQRLEEAQVNNDRVAAHAKHLEAKTNRDRLSIAVATEDAAVKKADQDKEDALAAVVFPVPGLGLSDDGVTFNGVPFEQASMAEQIRVSVAIGLALNPSLKILLIRNGNVLDSDSLKAVAEQAKDADAQVWLEWVAESKDGVSVMLEAGAVI